MRPRDVEGAETLKRRSLGRLTIAAGVAVQSYPCPGCMGQANRLKWHEGFVKWLCADCAPELVLAIPVPGG